MADNFDGDKFRNSEPIDHGTGAHLKWAATRERGPWANWTESVPGPTPPQRVGKGAMRVTFVNHATVLLQMDGVNLLTDPVWSDRAGPTSWAGTRRRRPPGLRLAQLPPIDAVLISHNHYDHLDLPTLRRLARTHRSRFVVGLGVGALLVSEGVGEVTELDWWRSVDVGGVRVTSVPARHLSGRGLCDRDRTLWAGYVVAGSSGRAYFAGDTGYGTHFAEIRRRLGQVRVALLPIGAYLPLWFMGPMHLSPEDAVRAHGDLGAGTSVAIHFGTFPSGDDGQDEAVLELGRARSRAGVPENRIWVPGFGEGRDVLPQ